MRKKYNKYAGGGLVNPYMKLGMQIAGKTGTALESNGSRTGTIGGSALKGAASGAAAGSIVGPWGTVIGGAIGGIAGAIGGTKKSDEKEKILEQEQKDLKQQQLLSLPTPSGGMLGGGVNPYNFAMGGLMDAESVDSYDNGGTHEQNPLGGIPIGQGANGIPNRVEEGEASFNFGDGKYIFSNRLDTVESNTLPKTVAGKSYAEAAKYIESLFEGRNSSIDNSTKKALMKRLRNSQEEVKQLENPPQQNQFAFGGLVPEDNSGVIPENPTTAIDNPINIYDYSISSEGLEESLEGYDITAKDKDFNVYDRNTSYNTVQKENKSNTRGGGNILPFLAMGAPLVTNALANRKLRESPQVQAKRLTKEVTPNFVNTQQIQRNLAQQLAGNRNALAAKSSGNFGQYAANLQSISAGSSRALANAQMQAEIANAGEKSRVQQANLGIEQFNLGQQTRADELNAQNSAAYSAQKAAYSSALGQNIANIGKTAYNYQQAQAHSAEVAKALKFLGLQNKKVG